MRKFISVVLAAALCITTPAIGDEGNEPFYDSGESLWRVMGFFPSVKYSHGYGCVAMTRWNDEESAFTLIHDIDNGQLGIQVKYNHLEFQGDDGDEFEGRLVFRKQNGAKKVFSMQYRRDSAHEMTISRIDPNVFIEPFATYGTLTVELAEGNGYTLSMIGYAEDIGHKHK